MNKEKASASPAQLLNYQKRFYALKRQADLEKSTNDPKTALTSTKAGVNCGKRTYNWPKLLVSRPCVSRPKNSHRRLLKKCTPRWSFRKSVSRLPGACRWRAIASDRSDLHQSVEAGNFALDLRGRNAGSSGAVPRVACAGAFSVSTCLVARNRRADEPSGHAHAWCKPARLAFARRRLACSPCLAPGGSAAFLRRVAAKANPRSGTTPAS